jgi:hypothetical protein
LGANDNVALIDDTEIRACISLGTLRRLYADRLRSLSQ